MDRPGGLNPRRGAFGVLAPGPVSGPRRGAVVESGCMLFHPGNDHWHVDASAAYALTPRGSTEPVVERAKVSFCLSRR